MTKNIVQLYLFLSFIGSSLSGFSYTKHGSGKPWMQQEDKNNLVPTFETTTLSAKITVPLGQPVILPCTVRNLGDKVVSWIRTKDLHIITSGILTYTSDSRFEVLHDKSGHSWNLRIRNTKLSDSGKYECQVNTDPKINYALLLTVTDTQLHDSPMSDSETQGPVATIRGPKEVYVRKGSTLTFTCVVGRRPPIFGSVNAPKSQLKWTHKGRDVSFQSTRGGISVDTDYRSSDVTSRLTVAMISQEDAGNYTCEDTNVRPDTVTVHVIDDEQMEAMIKDSSRASSSKCFSNLGWSFLIVIIFQILEVT